MKKAIAILLSLTMILGLAACGNSASQTEQPSTEDTSVESKADTNSAENSTDMENTDNQDVQDHKVWLPTSLRQVPQRVWQSISQMV